MEIKMDNFDIDISIKEIASYDPNLVMSIIEELVMSDKDINDFYQQQKQLQQEPKEEHPITKDQMEDFTTMDDVLNENDEDIEEIFIIPANENMNEKDLLDIIKQLFGDGFDDFDDFSPNDGFIH